MADRRKQNIKVCLRAFKSELKAKELEIADLFNGKYKTKEMCRVIQVAHSTFYNHDRRGVKVTQNFAQSRPNLFWVGDVMEVKINSEKFYICTVMDLFSRKIVGYRLSSQNNNKPTINTFKDAFELHNRLKGLTFHCDQGSNYTSNEFADLLDAVNVGQSLS